MIGRRSNRRRAFSLLEAMAIVVMVAVAVPPMASIAQSNAVRAGDATRRHAAMHLAVGVTEAVLADSESTHPLLGFEGFARADYLTAQGIGLRSRLARLEEPAAAFGVTYEVSFSDPFTAAGDPASADADLALRIVTVRAAWTTVMGRDGSIELKTAVVNR